MCVRGRWCQSPAQSRSVTSWVVLPAKRPEHKIRGPEYDSWPLFSSSCSSGWLPFCPAVLLGMGRFDPARRPDRVEVDPRSVAPRAFGGLDRARLMTLERSEHA